MAFFKFRNRSKSSTSTNTIVISKPIPAKQDDDVQPSRQQRQQQQQQQRQSTVAMDHDNRRSPPTPLKLRGSYYALNTATSMSRVPSSPLPPLPSFDSADDLSTPNGYSDGEVGYSRGIAKFERVRTESEDTMRRLSPERIPINRLSTSTDGTPEFLPIGISPPKLKLSFESNITEAGSVYDLDTPPNHRVAFKPTFKSSSSRHASSPERIITTPAVTNSTNTNPHARQRTTSSSGSQLRRQSAVYNKRRASMEGTETSSSRSGKSTLDSPEDRDSGFHEDFDEALRSKPPSPDTKPPSSDRVNNNSNTSFRVREREKTTSSPERVSLAITPERAPLIPSEGRITPITLVDPGVTRKPVATKPVSFTLPQIEKMETFKETFSTNLFENTLPPEKSRNLLLSPKPVVPKTKGKVLTPAEFEKMRQEADNESDDEDEEEDVARDESYQAEVAQQRRRQQAALSVYRQQMTKVVGANASPTLRPLSQIGEMPEVPEIDDESEEIPLGILMAHGFPQTNNRPSSARPSSRASVGPQRNVTLEPKIRTPSPGNLPVFAKNLPTDPHAMGLPRSNSAFDLRPSGNGSNSPSLGSRTNSSPAVPTLLDSYQTRQRKGAMFLDPNIEVPGQVIPQEQSYFNQVPQHYEMMGMQAVPGHQGMIQYVPVMVTPPLGSQNLGPTQPGTLMQELYDRQQFGAQNRLIHRSSQYNLQQAQYAQQQQIPQYMPSHHLQSNPISRPQSIYADPRRSFYDQKSIYSSSSQQPTARPKLPSTNPAHRFSTASNSAANPGRYRASTYAGAGLGVTNSDQRRVSSTNVDDEDAGWESLRRKKEEMQARRMTRLQTAA